MAMIEQVSAIARRGSIEVNLLDKPALDQRVQAVVNGGQRDGWHMLFRTHKHLNRSGMITLLEKNGEHFLALPSQPDSAGCQALCHLGRKLHLSG